MAPVFINTLIRLKDSRLHGPFELAYLNRINWNNWPSLHKHVYFNPTLQGLRLKDQAFQSSLGYVERFTLKYKTTGKQDGRENPGVHGVLRV